MIVYGTRIRSDINFPLNIPDDQITRPEVCLSREIPEALSSAINRSFPFYQAHGRKINLCSDRNVFGKGSKKQPWCYEVKDVLRFYWFGGEETIYYQLFDKGNSDRLSFWFIHLLLPLYFTLENRFDYFHAGAVGVEDKTILFLAPSMGGKSTMTDFFIKRGHSLISDDKVATYPYKDQFMAVSSHPYHRPYRKFEELGIRAHSYTNISAPIHVFYDLQKTSADSEVQIREVTGVDKFNTILPKYLYMFPYLKTYRLHYLSKILHSVRMFRVAVPWDMRQLRSVHDAIFSHCRNVS